MSRGPSGRTLRTLVAAVALVVVAGVVAWSTLGAPGSDPLYGAAFPREPGEDFGAALARNDAELGLDVVRVFYEGVPDPWPGKAPGRPVVASFKLDPVTVLTGRYDDEMRAWFADAPDDRDVFWVLWHEPEEDIEAGLVLCGGLPSGLRAARLPGRPGRQPAPALDRRPDGYSTRAQSGRTWRDYVPPVESVDVLAWDVYNREADEGRYASPAELLDAARKASESIGRRFAVAELGSVLAPGDDGTGRAAWIADMGAYCAEHDAEFVIWFNHLWNQGADDYRLDDRPSIEAWRRLSGG